MPKSQPNPYITYLLEDVFGEVGGVSARAMFGGYGLYKNGLIFAIVVDDDVYMKVGDNNREQYEEHHSHPFVYSQGNHQPTTMSYWLLPSTVMEDSAQLREWVEESLAAHAQKKRPAR